MAAIAISATDRPELILACQCLQPQFAVDKKLQDAANNSNAWGINATNICTHISYIRLSSSSIKP